LYTFLKIYIIDFISGLMHFYSTSSHNSFSKPHYTPHILGDV